MYFIYDDYYLLHENGISHPENPERLKHIKEKAGGLKEKGVIEFEEPQQAEKSQIGMVHTMEYIDTIRELSAKGGLSFLDLDTGVNKYTYDCALLAVGGCFRGIDLIFSDKGKYRKFFLACRPPGHHAFPSYGSGFCIFNNAALGTKYALKQFNIRKAAIVDFDAHHGNGTQDVFYEDDDVFYISFHQYPHYPGSGNIDERGRGKGEGFNLNFPFGPGTREPDYLAAIVDIVLPVLEGFEPELVMISAGYDSHFSDSMSSLGLVEDSYRKITEALLYISYRCCGGRMAIVLEGGYEYKSTAGSAAATIEGAAAENGFKSIDDIKAYLNIDDDYRKSRVKNKKVLEQAAAVCGLDIQYE